MPQVSDRFRALLEELAGGVAEHTGVAEQEPVDLDGGDVAGGEAQDEQPTLLAQ